MTMLHNDPATGPALPVEMLTLTVTLHGEGPTENRQLALALPKPEWLGLVSHFTRMPADERARVGHSIQAAAARNPFPTHGDALTPNQQQACDAFVSDCVLLAALAEVTTPRALVGTAVEGYAVTRGNAVRPRLH